MMELKKIVSDILSGKEFLMHSLKGYNRKNCIYATSVQNVPRFLIEDGAVEISKDKRYITFYSVANVTTREFPVYFCYDEVAEQFKNRVAGEYAAWPKDDGQTAVQLINGRCYNPSKIIRAAILSEKSVPNWVIASGMPIKRLDSNTYELIRANDKQGKNIRQGCMGKSIWIEYKRGDIDILSLDEISKSKYIITTSGKDIGLLEVFLRENLSETA